MFKIGFSTLGCPAYSVRQVAALARDSGFDGVEIRFISGVVDLPTLPEFSASGIAETRKVFDDAGVEVNCVDTSVRFNSGTAEELAAQRELAKVNCEIANALGARYIRIFGGSRPAATDPDTFLSTVADGAGAVADDAHQAGVEALLETHDAFCTAATVQPVLDRSSEHLGVLWDFMHSFRNGESAEQTWAGLGPRIRHVHVKDGSVATPEKFDLVLTGTGIVPLIDVVRVLRTADFSGYVDFEWEKAWHPEIEEPEVAIPHFRTAIDAIINQA